MNNVTDRLAIFSLSRIFRERFNNPTFDAAAWGAFLMCADELDAALVDVRAELDELQTKLTEAFDDAVAREHYRAKLEAQLLTVSRERDQLDRDCREQDHFRIEAEHAAATWRDRLAIVMVEKENLKTELAACVRERDELRQQLAVTPSWANDDDGEARLFRVWDRERQCWAGDDDGRTPNVRDLEKYALDEFKDAKLVYCDMEGWSLADCGELYLHDECGNSVTADPARYEVRLNPKWLAECGQASALRWRDRAEVAETELAEVTRAREALRQQVLQLEVTNLQQQNEIARVSEHNRQLCLLVYEPED